MAAIDNNRITYTSTSDREARGTFLSTFLGTIRAWNDTRMTRKALHSLSDRELEDIGLVRGDIEAVACRRG